MDIRCVRLQPFQVGERILVSSEVIIPLPEAEQYRLGVQRKRREVIDARATKAGRLIPRLLEADALSIGDTLYFKQSVVPAEFSPPWSIDEPLYRATLVTDQGTRTLSWKDPETEEEQLVSPSLLAAILLHRFGLRDGEVSSEGINGMIYWTTDGEQSLRDLAGARVVLGRRSNRRIDKQALRDVCRRIPAGTWTTYGDIAAAIGVPGAAQSVAGVIATDPEVQNPHRVLRSNGQVSPGWTNAAGEGPAFAQTSLRDEGVAFDDAGIADSACCWNPLTAASVASEHDA